MSVHVPAAPRLLPHPFEEKSSEMFLSIQRPSTDS